MIELSISKLLIMLAAKYRANICFSVSTFYYHFCHPLNLLLFTVSYSYKNIYYTGKILRYVNFYRLAQLFYRGMKHCPSFKCPHFSESLGHLVRYPQLAEFSDILRVLGIKLGACGYNKFAHCVRKRSILLQNRTDFNVKRVCYIITC